MALLGATCFEVLSFLLLSLEKPLADARWGLRNWEDGRCLPPTPQVRGIAPASTSHDSIHLFIHPSIHPSIHRSTGITGKWSLRQGLNWLLAMHLCVIPNLGVILDACFSLFPVFPHLSLLPILSAPPQAWKLCLSLLSVAACILAISATAPSLAFSCVLQSSPRTTGRAGFSKAR